MDAIRDLIEAAKAEVEALEHLPGFRNRRTLRQAIAAAEKALEEQVVFTVEDIHQARNILDVVVDLWVCVGSSYAIRKLPDVKLSKPEKVRPWTWTFGTSDRSGRNWLCPHCKHFQEKLGEKCQNCGVPFGEPRELPVEEATI